MRKALFLSACLLAGAATAAPSGDEQLVVRPYPAAAPWKQITNKSNADGWIHEQIPANQTVDGFSDILTDQGFRKLGGKDPATFLKFIFTNITGACDGVRVNGPAVRTEGGFPVAYAQVYCGQQRGAGFGVHIFYKAIGGDAGLYSISREFHVPPSPDGGRLEFPKGHEREVTVLLTAEAAANRYLTDDVYVCGGSSTDPRCGR